MRIQVEPNMMMKGNELYMRKKLLIQYSCMRSQEEDYKSIFDLMSLEKYILLILYKMMRVRTLQKILTGFQVLINKMCDNNLNKTIKPTSNTPKQEDCLWKKVDIKVCACKVKHFLLSKLRFIVAGLHSTASILTMGEPI